MKQKLLILVFILLNITVFSQITVNEGFESNSTPNGWAYSGFEQVSTSGTACTGTKAISANLYGVSVPTSTASVAFNANNSNGQAINISFKYKAEATNTSNPVVTGNFKVEYSFDNGSSYYLVGSAINLTGSVITCTNFTGTIPVNTSSSNSNLKFRITAKNENSGDWKLIIDDVVLNQAILCTGPSNSSVSNIQTTSAKINWSSTYTPSNGFEVYYTTSYTAPTATTIPSLSGISNTYVVLNSLEQGVRHYVYIRSNCGSQVSPWVLAGGNSFITLCGSWDLPYFQDFNSIPPMYLPPCHRTDNVAGAAWWVNPIETQNYGSGNALGTPDNTWFFTKGLNLQAGVTYMLKYNRPRKRVNSRKRLKIAYGLTQDYMLMTNIIYNQTAPYNADSGQEIFYFTPAQSAVYYLGFNTSGSGFGDESYSIAIDDISLDVATSCRIVENASVSSITQTSATVEWSAPSIIPSGGYDLYYSTDDAYPSSSVIPNYQGITNLSQDLSSLEPGKRYFVWLRSRCSSAQFSDWKRFHFSTACQTYVTTPYIEDFEKSFVGEIPNCTSMEYILPQITETIAEVRYKYNANWPSKVLVRDYDYNTVNSWFFTKPIYLESGRQYKMTYLYGIIGSYSPYYQLQLKVAFGNLPNSASMINIIQDYQAVQSPNSSAEHLFSVPATGIYYIGFNDKKDNTYNYLIMDNISITDNGVLATNDIDRNSDTNVYPNPFRDKISISDIKDIKSIEIKDVSGRLIKSLAVAKEISLGELNSGVYFISLQYKDGFVKTIKIVKNN
ncbi:Por secretion system C-terminal sorting domain-containing protein [Chryseobacterium taeanense]|uniref:Por secretion system C-terminal sorting domain-containing protein n=1 Tax=Chryseobacterium taeanense TaxID=311334 RepID=A0A1G8KJR6_9FLAO|nr:T9SS type A sorting domain-containing protein [Chryseobacterium taeanense]SDI43140.1 Por secretion system C-terminal sorting domain-containing protein [Chryseobacterium taeanense]